LALASSLLCYVLKRAKGRYLPLSGTCGNASGMSSWGPALSGSQRRRAALLDICVRDVLSSLFAGVDDGSP
jgi:hypothetical protein